MSDELETQRQRELDDLYEFLRGKLDKRDLSLFRMLEFEELPVTKACERLGMNPHPQLYQWRIRVHRLVWQWRQSSGSGV